MLSGSTWPDSGEVPNRYSGWRMTNWSIGAGEAIRIDNETLVVRPDRPACCQQEAMVPGNPAITDASSPPMSMPSSSALVDTTPRSDPSRSPRSIRRRSFGR